MNLVITEEPSKDSSGKPSSIFYIREKPFRAGFSVQMTSLNRDGAEWLVQQINKKVNENV